MELLYLSPDESKMIVAAIGPPLVGFVVGVLTGYGIRSYISMRRRKKHLDRRGW